MVKVGECIDNRTVKDENWGSWAEGEKQSFVLTFLLVFIGFFLIFFAVIGLIS